MLPTDAMLTSDNIVTTFAFLENPDTICVDLFRHVICLFARPPCNNDTNLLMPVCSESCLAFDRYIQEKRCDKEFLSLEKTLLDTNAEVLLAAIAATTQFNCRNVSTYYLPLDGITPSIDSELCTDLLTSNQTSKFFFKFHAAL